MSQSKIFLFITICCVMGQLTDAVGDKLATPFRSSENKRALQDDSCSYHGNVGWLNCNSAEYECKEGYTCENYSWAGVRCVRDNCGDEVDEDDTNRLSDDTGDGTGLCVDNFCTTDSECESGESCVVEGLGGGCCVDLSESTSDPTQAPTQAPTEAPTESPTESPTQSPTEAPTESSDGKKKKKKKDSKDDKSKKYDRQLSHLSKIEDQIPTRRLRGSKEEIDESIIS